MELVGVNPSLAILPLGYFRGQQSTAILQISRVKTHLNMFGSNFFTPAFYLVTRRLNVLFHFRSMSKTLSVKAVKCIYLLQVH